MKQVAEQNIKEWRDAKSSTQKSKLKYECADKDYQSFLYQHNQILNGSKYQKSFDKITRIKEEKKLRATELLKNFQLELHKIKLIECEIASKTMPIITKGIFELNMELADNLKKAIIAYMEIYKNVAQVRLSDCLSQNETSLLFKLQQIDNFIDTSLFLKNFLSEKEKAAPILGKSSRSHSELDIFKCEVKEYKSFTEEYSLKSDDTQYKKIVFDECIEFLNKYAVKTMGIHRVSGSQLKIKQLKSEIEAQIAKEDDPAAFVRSLLLSFHPKPNDHHVVSGLLKLYLREMQPFLASNEFITKFIQQDTISEAEAEDCVAILRKTNQENELFKKMSDHLKFLAINEEENKMSIFNLATIFGPTIFGVDMPLATIVPNVGLPPNRAAYENSAKVLECFLLESSHT